MVKLKYKKAKEMWQLLLIILGIAVVVILLLGFWKGSDYIFGKIGLLPGQDLETIRQGCVISASAKLSADFCDQFKLAKLPSEDRQYINCQYFDSLGADISGNPVEIHSGICGDKDKKSSAAAFCNTLKDPTKYKINGFKFDKDCK